MQTYNNEVSNPKEKNTHELSSDSDKDTNPKIKKFKRDNKS